MKKQLFLAFAALLLVTALNAQTTYKADKRLYDVLSSEYIAQLEASKSELIPYYNYYLDNCYYTVNLKTAQKLVTGTDIRTVAVADDSKTFGQYFKEKTYSKENFNALKYKFELSSNNFITYLWNDAGIAIVFKPLSQISGEFKAYMKQLK